MNENMVDAAMKTATLAAERARNYKPETYAAVLLFELMKSAATQRRPYELSSSTTIQVPKPEKPYSASELFATKSWTTEIDKVLVAGYYLERFGAIASYTIDELRNCLVSAKVPLPKNVSLAVLQAVQKGLMMEIPAQGTPRKAWALTQTGERYVEDMTLKSKGSSA